MRKKKRERERKRERESIKKKWNVEEGRDGGRKDRERRGEKESERKRGEEKERRKREKRARRMGYGVATISRLLKIIGLFCKRALLKRRYSAKETYNFSLLMVTTPYKKTTNSIVAQPKRLKGRATRTPCECIFYRSQRDTYIC